MVAEYRCLCRGLSSRRELSQRPILPAPACLAYILLSFTQCRGNRLHTGLSLQRLEEEAHPMKRTGVALAILAAMTLVIGPVHVFAQGVATWKEVTITKTVPPGPSDEEVITRRQ